MSDINLVFANKDDVPEILMFIKKLADYQKLSHQVVATEELLEKYLFGEKRCAEVIFAQIDKKNVGFCLFFYNFASFLAKPGIYIEDIYVNPEYRNQGIGKKFFEYIERIAKQKDCSRIEWVCLDGNKKSIEFYKSLGAKPMQDWTTFRLELL